MTAADRRVPVKTFFASVEKMVAALQAQPPFKDDVEWTYEIDDGCVLFFQKGVFVERWVVA